MSSNFVLPFLPLCKPAGIPTDCAQNLSVSAHPRSWQPHDDRAEACAQVAKSIVEAHDARLDTVLRVFGQMYNHAALHTDQFVAGALQISLDKCWRKMDQAAFILAYFLNPSCRFLHLADGLHASHLAQAAQALYRRLFPEDQNGALSIHGQFAEYSAGMGSFTGVLSASSMLLLFVSLISAQLNWKLACQVNMQNHQGCCLDS